MKVKITKISSVDDPVYPTPDNKDYEHGQINEKVSIPNDYWIIGVLMNPVVVGKRVSVLREIRNGVKIGGLFETSPVAAIKEDIFETANSKYRIDYLD